MVPERLAFWEIYPQTFGWTRWFVYGMAVVALTVFGYGLYRRVSLWLAGKPAPARFDNLSERVSGLIRYGFIQVKILKEAYPGIFHGFIFSGFVALFIGTSLTFLDEDFYRLITGKKFIHGNFYVVFSFVLDIAGVLFLIGLGLAAYRRYLTRSERLDNKPEDWIFLALVTLIVVTGFFSEALRISNEMPDFEKYSSPVGYLLGGMFDGLASNLKMTVHALFWFCHLLLALGFVAYLPFSKGLHILTGWFNVYTRNLEPKGKLPSIPNMMERMEAGEEFGMGYKSIDDFTWKDRLMLDACTRCGRCQEACPAFATGKKLNPKLIIQNARDLMLETLAKNGVAGSEAGKAQPFLLQAEGGKESGVFSSQELWDCTNCMACMEACPVLIEHIPLIFQMRRELAMEFDDMGPECRSFFKNMDVNANPWGMNPADRSNWTEGLDVPTVFDNPDYEYLFFVGCMASYDPRSQSIAKSMVQILKAAEINFAILGEMELCCGDPLRRLGNEASFQALVGLTKESLKEAQVSPKKVITICPHCYNTLAFEYREFGLDWEVMHHTVFIADLIKQGKIRFNDSEQISAVLHDSCFLGRYNDLYQQPRKVAEAAGAKLTEISQSRQDAFCCGGGGGRLWLEEEAAPGEDKINMVRVAQLAQSGASTFLSACPYCMSMFDEGVKLKKVKKGDPIWKKYNLEQNGHVNSNEVDLFDLVALKDIAELVAERMVK